MSLFGNKSAPIQATWSGNATYTLTNAYIASDDITIDFPKRLTIYPYYSAGAAEVGNTLDWVLEVNPLDAISDPTGVYWSQMGNYVNAAGTWTEQNSKFLDNQGVAGTYEPGVPLDFTNLNGSRMRFRIKENGVMVNPGTCRIWVVKADIS
jgi:hypothetical protein